MFKDLILDEMTTKELLGTRFSVLLWFQCSGMLLRLVESWPKLLSKNLSDGVEEGGGDGGEEEVGQHVDHGGGDGEGGEQRAGVWRLGCGGCGAGSCELRTVVIVLQLKQDLNLW